MEGAPLSLIVDVVVLVLLGLTIVYAARLSLQLRRLRDSKSDLDKVVRDLIKNLDRADRAIGGLKEAAKESGADLQEAIDKAMALSDELQLINDSGERLASRLETLVDGARPMISANAASPKTAAPLKASSTEGYAQHLRKLDAGDEKPGKLSFSIRDPEVERGMDPTADKVALEEDGSGQGLYSEAERDLFRAMKGKSRAV